MLAADARTAITFSLSPGNAHDAPEGRELLKDLGPLPALIKLDSLTDICTEWAWWIAAKALLQNAFAAITEKIRYKTRGGKEKWAEIGYTRYSVIFTGEVLPDRSQADAVYTVLNPPYRDLLNQDQTEFDALRNALCREHQPADTTEQLLVNQLAQSHWLLQRAIRLQNECFAADGVDEKRLALFLRYGVTHERAFHKALRPFFASKKTVAKRNPLLIPASFRKINRLFSKNRIVLASFRKQTARRSPALPILTKSMPGSHLQGKKQAPKPPDNPEIASSDTGRKESIMAEVVNCPICHRRVPMDDANMPFCSDRCRTLDLANWATEKYAIPSAEQPSDLEDIEPPSRHERSHERS